MDHEAAGEEKLEEVKRMRREAETETERGYSRARGGGGGFTARNRRRSDSVGERPRELTRVNTCRVPRLAAGGLPVITG